MMLLRKLASLVFLALLFGALPVLPIHAQEQHSTQKDAGAAQPRPDERNPADAEQKEEGEAEQIRNAPAVRTIARWTGLSNTQVYWICVVLNFAVVAALLAWVAKKKAPGIFKSRSELIQKKIEEARKTGEDARRRLTEVEARLSRLDVEITEMRREADANAREEEKRVQLEVEEERSRIIKVAEQEIAAAAGAARRDLKAYAAGLAVDLAEKKMKIGKETDQTLVREFTAQLGKDGN